MRTPSGKLSSARAVGASTNQQQQPHIAVAVAPLGPAAPSKWEDPEATAVVQATKGNMMVDTGAAVTLVTKAWADVHGLRISPPQGVSIRGAAGHSVEVVGTTQMTL